MSVYVGILAYYGTEISTSF